MDEGLGFRHEAQVLWCARSAYICVSPRRAYICVSPRSAKLVHAAALPR